jgi:hypothetical protein
MRNRLVQNSEWNISKSFLDSFFRPARQSDFFVGRQSLLLAVGTIDDHRRHDRS